jgi:hypothetical protein
MSLYKPDRDIHIFQLLDALDLDHSPHFITPMYPPEQDLAVISTLFQNFADPDYQSNETAFIECLHDIYTNLEAIRLAPIHSITQFMNFCDLADTLLISCVNPCVVCDILNCVRAAVMTDPVVLRDFHAHPLFKLHLAALLNPTNLSIIESILLLFQFFITEYDDDIFTKLWVLLPYDYDSISVYIGFAALFSTVAKFVPDVRKALFFIRVFAFFIAKKLWRFTLDGLLSLMCFDTSYLIHYNLALLPEDFLNHKTVLDYICRSLPRIPASQLATGLRIVRDLLEVLIGIHPALGRHIDLGFLLDIEDPVCLCLAVDIFKAAVRSRKMTATIIQGGYLIRLFEVMKDQLFSARMSAVITFSRVITSLPEDQLACLLEYGFAEHLMYFLDNDFPELVREVLLGFQRLVTVSPEMAIFVTNHWDEFAPLIDSPDETISRCAFFLEHTLFSPDD